MSSIPKSKTKGTVLDEEEETGSEASVYGPSDYFLFQKVQKI